MSLLTTYLVSYNLFAAGAWSYFLFQIITLLQAGTAYASIYSLVFPSLAVAQTLAVLEIVHAMTGFVRSPVATTAMQVSSRILLVWGIWYLAPTSRESVGFPLASVSWGLVEIPRYIFYAVNLLGPMPYILKYLRYSLFSVLYPSGISGEVLSILAALPYLVANTTFTLTMPNRLNFAFDYVYFLYFILATYVPGSYIMYSHMLVQRKKQLSPAPAENKKQQ